jgi:hypothetical protein
VSEVRVWVLYYDAFGDHGVCNVFGTPDEEWSGRDGYRIAPYTVALPDGQEEP